MLAAKYYQLFKVQTKITMNYQCTPSRTYLSNHAVLTLARGHPKRRGRNKQQYCCFGDSVIACGAQRETH